MKFIATRLWLAGLLIVVLSCAKKEEALPYKLRGALVEATLEGSMTRNQVVDAVSELSAAGFATYDVEYYVLTYRTVYNDKPIDTRGLLILPKGATTIDLLTYLHGTLVPLKMAGVEKLTPSLYRGEKEKFIDVRNMGLSWASAGFTVFIPDYIGYGSTFGKEHPYVYYPELFKANIDGLLASKEFLAGKGFADNKKLFITGWSQGGGAAISAHKFIQENYASDFTVVASSGLAGPYNFERFMNEIFKQRSEEVKLVALYSWALYSLNKFSDIKRPTDQIWSYPVYNQTNAYMPPSNVPNNIFNNYFLTKMIDGSDKQMAYQIRFNSFHDGWQPVGKVFLHHGDADDVVPYFNSEDAYNGLTAAGGDVKLYTYPGGKHDTEVGNYVLNTLNDFNALR
jgi:S-formylglutathione hydrolase FrmB